MEDRVWPAWALDGLTSCGMSQLYVASLGLLSPEFMGLGGASLQMNVILCHHARACSVTQLCPTLSSLMDCILPPLTVTFSRQEYWSRLLPFSPPGHLPNPGIEPTSLVSPALAGKFFTTGTTWESLNPYFQISRNKVDCEYLEIMI